MGNHRTERSTKWRNRATGSHSDPHPRSRTNTRSNSTKGQRRLKHYCNQEHIQDSRQQWSTRSVDSWNRQALIQDNITRTGTSSSSSTKTTGSRRPQSSNGFGCAASATRTFTRIKEEHGQEESPQWPPEFYSNGASYVLDPKSSMYYDFGSCFFFDPRSDLYYGNKESAYYRHDPTKTPPFQRLLQVPTTTTMMATTMNHDERTRSSCDIMNTTEVLPQRGTQQLQMSTCNPSRVVSESTRRYEQQLPPPSPPPLQGQPKQNRKNVSWDILYSANVSSSSISNSNKNVSAAAVATPRPAAVVRTKKGEPICIICRRKFKSLKWLRIHELKSKLHQENTSKVMQVVA